MTYAPWGPNRAGDRDGWAGGQGKGVLPVPIERSGQLYHGGDIWAKTGGTRGRKGTQVCPIQLLQCQHRGPSRKVGGGSRQEVLSPGLAMQGTQQWSPIELKSRARRTC